MDFTEAHALHNNATSEHANWHINLNIDVTISIDISNVIDILYIIDILCIIDISYIVLYIYWLLLDIIGKYLTLINIIIW